MGGGSSTWLTGCGAIRFPAFCPWTGVRNAGLAEMRSGRPRPGGGRYVRLSIADMGFAVTESASGSDAAIKLQSGDSYALLITDYMMPDLLGTEVAGLAARQRPGLPVLIITGYADAEGLPNHLARMTKPFRLDELSARIAALLAHG